MLVHAAAVASAASRWQLAMKGLSWSDTASAQNHEFLRGLGADEAIDYTVCASKTRSRRRHGARRYAEKPEAFMEDAQAGRYPGFDLGLEDPPVGVRHARYLFANAAHWPRLQSWSDGGRGGRATACASAATARSAHLARVDQLCNLGQFAALG